LSVQTRRSETRCIAPPLLLGPAQLARLALSVGVSDCMVVLVMLLYEGSATLQLPQSECEFVRLVGAS